MHVLDRLTASRESGKRMVILVYPIVKSCGWWIQGMFADLETTKEIIRLAKLGREYELSRGDVAE